MEFTLVDGGVAAVTLVSGLLAYSRGVTREIFAIGGWIIAALAAFYLAPMLEPLMREAPVVGPILEKSCIFSMIAAFTLIVAFTLLILSVFTPLASSLVLGSPLAPVDRVLGFVFGIARGLLLIAIAYLLFQTLGGGEPWAPLENAASKTVVAEGARLLAENVPAQVPDWFQGRIDALMAPCSGGAAPAGSLTPGGSVVVPGTGGTETVTPPTTGG
ncbi:CvpA family protein [Limibaculum sp. FT325]|uniref:CvpA family protein n=1 Tax=Thermohalobaculum sediminis TaxID=2939436 RepID=UPI0020C14026|nr:CvpA family protein [Limibaculum sediminis]MCL5775607.1 CvpA family protein [Limibaculum sediminis]